MLIQWEKDIRSANGAGASTFDTYIQKINFHVYFTPYTDMNSNGS